MLTYEQKLDHDTGWALSEGSRHFEEKSQVHEALREIAHRLHDLHVPYAVVGGMALFLHGFRRFTEDVDILVTADGLAAVHQNLVGPRYVRFDDRSNDICDANRGVRIEFLIAGQYPGDGRPKPVAFPDPAANVVEKEGICCLSLPRLIEVKLASGLTNAGRLRDLADVQELIRHLNLDRALSDELDSSVRDKYLELWTGLQQGQREP